MDKSFAQNEVRERAFNAYNDKCRTLTVDELYSELTSDLNLKHSQPKRSDVEKVLKEMTAAGLLCYRGASTYDFICNYAELLSYITALTRPIKQRASCDLISKDVLTKSTWMLDMSFEAKDVALPDIDESEDIDFDLDLNEIEDLFSDDDEEEEDEDEIDAAKLRELEAELEGRKTDKTALFYEAKKRIIEWAKNRPNYDSKSLSFTTNFRTAFAPNDEFKIRIHANEKKHEIYLTDCGTTFRAISSLIAGVKHPILLTSEKLLHKASDEGDYQLCIFDNEVGIPCDAENEAQFEMCVLMLVRNVSWFIANKLAWLSPSQDKSARIDAFFNRTKENRYEARGQKSFEELATSLIERVILLDYYLTREDAIQLSERLKSYISQKKTATKTTKELFERLHMEFYLASDKEYMTLRDQLYLEQMSA